jgi:hypothetical protein
VSKEAVYKEVRSRRQKNFLSNDSDNSTLQVLRHVTVEYHLNIPVWVTRSHFFQCGEISQTSIDVDSLFIEISESCEVEELAFVTKCQRAVQGRVN